MRSFRNDISNWSTAMDTINYALSIDAHLASFAVLVPFPGTDLIEKARAGDGLRLIDSDWNGYDKQVGGACEPVAGGSYTYASTVVKRATSTTPVAAL